MNESVGKEKNICKEIKSIFNQMPKIGKRIVLITLLILVACVCLTISSVFTIHSKATKFGLKDVGELVTQTAYVTIVQDSEEDREFFKLFKIPFTKSRMIFSYDFTVDASVDFKNISYKVNDEKKEIKVELPHAKHYKTTMIIESQEVYLDEESLFSRIDLKEQNKAILEMQNKAKNTAIENNLLEAADKNAQRIIGAMLKSDSSKNDYSVIYNYID